MTKTIVITGASSGLGAEMARQFAALGYDLGLCARRADRLEELRAKILPQHPERRIELRTLDVTDHDQRIPCNLIGLGMLLLWSAMRILWQRQSD